MEHKAIEKPSIEELPFQPNLTDYEGVCENFSWKDMEKELDWLDGSLNAAYECIDRHVKTRRRDKVALYWEGKDGTTEKYTFAELKEQTDRFANVLRSLGVQKGDRVFIFLERVPEIFISLFGALKLGAVVGPLFSAFGPEAIKDRMLDSGASVLVAGLEMIDRIHAIRGDLPALEKIIVVDKRGRGGELKEDELRYEEAMAEADSDFEIEKTSPEDFSIMHYTSGTTGKPKGAAHVHYSLISQYATAKYILDLTDTDIYWCTADPGWVTGTSYGMLGPWSNGATLVFYEGGFSADTWYNIIQKYKVTVWYTAPTAIRMLMKAGSEITRKYDLSSLRYMCSVGEPLNPEAIVWGEEAFGLAFHDNWWQTETGCILIANYPVMDIRLGSMGKPFPGIEAAILDEEFEPLPAGQEGHLAIKPGWPAMFRTYWNNKELYDSRFKKGWYITGDRAYMDEDGYFWFVGRADDVINTAGHLVGPFEVESALVEHEAVAEAAVIGKPDPERYEIVKAFVSLKNGYDPSDELKDDIIKFVRNRLAAHAYPRELDFYPSLPKTRSGKIMRRLLKARELGLPEGDTSTLEDD